MIIIKKTLPLIATVALLSAYPVTAFAYLDPGTGSMILQGVIGAIAIGMATGKMWWYRLKGMFSSESDSLQEESDSVSESKVDD